MPAEQTPRERAIARVVALSEVTTENGATAHEQNTAAALAQRLIQKHGLTLHECEAAAQAEALRRQPTIVQAMEAHRRQQMEAMRRQQEAMAAYAQQARGQYFGGPFAPGTTTVNAPSGTTVFVFRF